MKTNLITTSGGVIFRDSRGKRQFFVVKMGEEDRWEFPKVTVRKGESSVRAILRLTGEMAGMNTRVLEEAGRSTGTTVVGGKSMPQRHFYYLMIYKAGGETLVFNKYLWLEYGNAIKKLELKKEKDVLRNGREVLKEWEKTKGKRI
jgi:hypothetical protein